MSGFATASKALESSLQAACVVAIVQGQAATCIAQFADNDTQTEACTRAGLDVLSIPSRFL